MAKAGSGKGKAEKRWQQRSGRDMAGDQDGDGTSATSMQASMEERCNAGDKAA
jgi:hypothetical protein